MLDSSSDVAADIPAAQIGFWVNDALVATYIVRMRLNKTLQLKLMHYFLRGACRRRRFGGFTLLELLVVIVIIGLLAGLVAPRYFDTVAKSKAKVARAQMDALEKALDQYRMEIGAFPTPVQGLEALMTQPAGIPKWQGPYLKKAVPLDPWGHAYIYKLSESQREVDLISLGSDGQPGGTSDAKDIALSSSE